MRAIVLGLLLANLLYFGWAEWVDVPAPPATSSIAGVPRLTLVSELSPDQRAALARKMAFEAPQCVSIGPFDDPSAAALAAALLKAKNFSPVQRAAEDPAVHRFWVYLDGFKTDAGEMKVLHRLEHDGLDDAEAMPADAGGRRISLGLFTDQDRAQRRVKVVRSLGLKPAMSERMLPGMVYWLDVTLANSTVAVPLKDVSDLQPSGGSSVSMKACPSAQETAAPLSQPQAAGSAAATPSAAASQAPAPASPRAPDETYWSPVL